MLKPDNNFNEKISPIQGKLMCFKNHLFGKVNYKTCIEVIVKPFGEGWDWVAMDYFNQFYGFSFFKGHISYQPYP